MEHDLNESGLANLDPMYFWKYVRKDKHRQTPQVVVQTEKLLEFCEIAKEAHNWKFIYLVNEFDFSDPHLPNLTLMWADALPKERLCDLYAQTDYVLCDENLLDRWLPAMFCGATPVHDLENLRRAINSPAPLSVLERIENWETAEKVLTFITTSDIKKL